MLIQTLKVEDTWLLSNTFNYSVQRECRGAATIFQREGHTKKHKKGLVSYDQDIVIAFSPSVVGSLVKKGLQKGGGHGHPRTPLPTPLE